ELAVLTVVTEECVVVDDVLVVCELGLITVMTASDSDGRDGGGDSEYNYNNGG
ncbi:hypothetical protein HAX54_038220, partial [Datura stramonium]|nr:hypothetical protein [Datura stramonium]